MFEFFGSTTTQQRLNAGPSSRIGVNVIPRFTVFHSPPKAEATYHTLGSLGSISRSAMRPVTRPGPSDRMVKPFIMSAVSGPALARPWASTGDAAIDDARPRARTDDMMRFTQRFLVEGCTQVAR